MANVKEILHRTPPPILYHYTTQEGLLGIIRNKEIWASHTQYLNDVREFIHATEILKQELERMKSEAGTNAPANKLLDGMQLVISIGLESVNVCVCSFSESGDVLSQWRAYGGRASGVAIGLSGPFLREMSEHRGWLAPVVYDPDEQRSLARTLLQDALSESLRKKTDAETSETIKKMRAGDVFSFGGMFEYLPRYAPIFKHHSFNEEKEWRIITKPTSCTNDRFDYRAGGSMLIPYFRLPLALQEKGAIKEIVIGPTPHPKQAKDALTGLLTKHDFPTSSVDSQGEAVRVRSSEIPYRNW
jgi:hypothetical protein